MVWMFDPHAALVANSIVWLRKVCLWSGKTMSSSAVSPTKKPEHFVAPLPFGLP